MISASEYRKCNERLMQEYEQRVRTWLKDCGEEELSKIIPFFRDGVTCPEVWFKEGNTFRPLIILKEVSLGVNCLKELPGFLNKWGNPQYFEFVENPFDDIKVGSFKQWRRIVRLVAGLEEVHNGTDLNYMNLDLNYSEGEAYSGDVEAYKTKGYAYRTANKNYESVVNRMAVIEIKKIGAGQSVNSELSDKTRHFAEHIEPFKDLLIRQIELIDPTVIICLGKHNGKFTSSLLEEVKRSTKERLWIGGYHHCYSSNRNFFERPIEAYRDYLNKSK